MKWLMFLLLPLLLFGCGKSEKEKKNEALRKTLPVFLRGKALPGGSFRSATKKLKANYGKTKSIGVVAHKIGNYKKPYAVIFVNDEDDDGDVDKLMYLGAKKVGCRRECRDMAYAFRKKRGIKKTGEPMTLLLETTFSQEILKQSYYDVKDTVGYKERVGDFYLYIFTFYTKRWDKLLRNFPLHVQLSDDRNCFIMGEYIRRR
jgi:rRNA processing protein Gar1